MWTKVAVAVAIFLFLFSTAWFLDEALQRLQFFPLQRMDDEQDQEEMQSFDLDHRPPASIDPVMEPFSPREYIRLFNLPLP